MSPVTSTLVPGLCTFTGVNHCLFSIYTVRISSESHTSIAYAHEGVVDECRVWMPLNLPLVSHINSRLDVRLETPALAQFEM